MGERVADRGRRSPKERLSVDGEVVFFPNEVARALDIADIQYHRLRRFYELIRNPSDSDQIAQALGRGWARFTVSDMAALVVGLTYAGGKDALTSGRRLVIGDLQRVCAVLYAQGFDYPLLQVGLVRVGRSFFADVDGVLRDTATGQLAIRQAADAADSYFDASLLSDARLAEALHDEVRRYRAGPRLPTE